MEFLEEKIFDREQYDTYIRRIHYDDRDAVMYEKMLHFLFPYIVEERGIEDKEGLMEEYIHHTENSLFQSFLAAPFPLLYFLRKEIQPTDMPGRYLCTGYHEVDDTDISQLIVHSNGYTLP